MSVGPQLPAEETFHVQSANRPQVGESPFQIQSECYTYLRTGRNNTPRRRPVRRARSTRVASLMSASRRNESILISQGFVSVDLPDCLSLFFYLNSPMYRALFLATTVKSRISYFVKETKLSATVGKTSQATVPSGCASRANNASPARLKQIMAACLRKTRNRSASREKHAGLIPEKNL